MQTWKNNDIPDKWKESPESIKNLMPDWKYVLMTDEDNRNFVKDHFPDFLSYYDNFPYNIQRADSIRYMWLYINGGIYLDLDIALQKNIEDLLGKQDSNFYLVKSSNIDSVYTNSMMISKPKVDFWLKVIEEMKKPPKWYYTKHFIIMCTTGPMMLTKVANKYGNSNFETIRSKKLSNCNVCNLDVCNDNPDSYTKFLQGSSWISFDTSVLLFFYCNKNKLIYYLYFSVIFIITISIYLYIKKYKKSILII